MIRECNGWRLWLAMAAGVAILVASGCADSGTLPAPAGETTWTTLTAGGGDLASCSIGCHTSGASASFGSLSLAAADYAGLSGTSTACTGAKFVTPNDKSKSSLYLMMVPGAAGCSPGTTMQAKQSASLATTLGAWIDAGAPQ